MIMDISRGNSSPKNKIANKITDGRALTRCPRFRVTKCVKFVDTIQQNQGLKKVTKNVDDGAGAPVRVKIVVTKKQLRQMVAAMNQGKTNIASTNQQLGVGLTSAELEHVLNALLKKRMKMKAEAEKEDKDGHWEPELKSIAEEID